MELKEILAISGQPGLYKYVAQSSHGVIVESLSDGKRMNAASNSKVSALTEISIFTEGEDIPLAEVFTKIYEHTQGQPAISHKEAPEKLKAYFAEVLPEYDRDRVHVSDMKKVSPGSIPSWVPGSPNSNCPQSRKHKDSPVLPFDRCAPLPNLCPNRQYSSDSAPAGRSIFINKKPCDP